MNSDEIALVQTSFSVVARFADEAAALFYARLFEIAPEVRPLFRGDIRQQGKKLMAALAVVVQGLTNLDRIVPTASLLAVRHVDYGVRPEHYPLVGEALLWTLERGLGEDFTPETRAAWAKAYGTLSAVMLQAAYGIRSAA